MCEVKFVNSFFRQMFRFKTFALFFVFFLSFLGCNKMQISDVASGEDSQSSGLSISNDPPPTDIPTDPPAVCNGTSCVLDPLTTKPAVTLILLALGDQANQQLIINGASSQLIAETVVRYTTPVSNPKILVVQDQDIHAEDPEDTDYVVHVLLQRYSVTYMVEPPAGLSDNDIKGYDLVWFNNPGHPMTSSNTYETLKRFKGGLILQGDDLSQGAGFSVQDLTKVKYIDNGTSAVCGNTTYKIDNDAADDYKVSMNSQYFPQGTNSNLTFTYGNDIDLTEVISNSVQVLASAKVNKAGCVTDRPAIVRYFVQ